MGEVVRFAPVRPDRQRTASKEPERPWAAFRRSPPTIIEDPTVADLEEAYIKGLERRDSRSLRVVRSVLRCHVLPTLGSVKVADLTPEEATAWWLWICATRGIGHSRLDTVLWVVRGILDIATPGALNPFRQMPRAEVRRRRSKGRGMGRQVLSVEAASRLVSSPQIPLARRALYAVAIYTGPRISELLGLQWRDWDRTRSGPLSCMNYERQWHEKDRALTPRKADDPADVPVVADCADLLAEWRSAWPSLLGREPLPSDPIFARLSVPRGRRHPQVRPLDHAQVRDLYNDDLLRLGITASSEDRRKFHSTRHTFLTLLPAAGAPESVIFSCTHAPDGSIKNVYRHHLWLMKCDALQLHPVRLVRSMEQRALFSCEPTPAPAPAEPQPAEKRRRRRRRAVQLSLFTESTS